MQLFGFRHSVTIDPICIPGIELNLACNGGLLRVIHCIIKKGVMSFAFEKTPSISLSCMLVPVLY